MKDSFASKRLSQHGAAVIVLGVGLCGTAISQQVSRVGGGAATTGAAGPAVIEPFQVTGVVNGAGFAGSPSPGSIATLFGFGLTSATASAASVPLPTSISDTTVLVSGTAAPLFYVSPQQINFQVPYEISPGVATITVTAAGSSADTFSLPIPQADPGIFTYGNNLAVATNQDGSLTDSIEPASPGSIITVYMTGLGQLDNPVPTDTVTPASPLSRPSLPVSATIGGENAPIEFIGLSPGSLALAQADLSVPSLRAGVYAVVITIGGVASNDPLITVGGN